MIFDQAPGGIALADLNLKFVEVNEAFCRLLGYRRADLLEMTVAQITHPLTGHVGAVYADTETQEAPPA